MVYKDKNLCLYPLKIILSGLKSFNNNLKLILVNLVLEKLKTYATSNKT